MDELNTYINVVVNLLLGNTRATDEYLADDKNMQTVLRVRNNLLETGMVKLSERIPLYRGILLHPDDAIENILQPKLELKTLSFTEDINAAKEFADTTSFMSSFVMSQNPDYKGYLITHTPARDEILFHYSWADKLKLGKISVLDTDIIQQQKEVILIQKGHRFKLDSYERLFGTSTERVSNSVSFNQK